MLQSDNLFGCVFVGKRVFIGDSVTPANETILVRAKQRDQWVTLPCASSVKNADVQLFKMLGSGVSAYLSCCMFF